MRNYASDPALREQWGITALTVHDLESASAAVAHLTKTAIYATDTDGYPVDTDLLDVFAAATCAQAKWTRDTAGVTGADALAGGASFMSLSLPAGKATTAADVQAMRYAPEAVEILGNHGLLVQGIASEAWLW